MKLRKTTLLAIFLSAAIGAPVTGALLDSQAEARPKGPEERREARKERAENRKERAEERRERRKDRRQRRKRTARRWAAGARKAWKAKKVHRRRMARRAFVRRWGKLHTRPKVKAELAVHAWREARFERMRFLAEKSGNEELLKKIDELEDKEDERHENHLDKLKGDEGAGGGAAAAEATDTAAPAETAAPATDEATE